MSWWKFGTSPEEENDIATKERRKEPRIGSQFKVRYSGSHQGEIIMGHATIVDLSRYGFGLKGARGLKRGMKLSLFIEMSDMDMSENLCIPDAYVTWIDGRRFGVTVRTAKDKEPKWLELLAG